MVSDECKGQTRMMERSTVADVLVVFASVLAELLIAVMFLARVYRPDRSERWGFAGTAMAVPVAAGAFINGVNGSAVSDVVLPLIFVLYAAVEVMLDGVLKADFRATRWLGPYLFLFYAAQFALIGYAFRVGTVPGMAVLVSYFVCLAMTMWSGRKVGHGRRGLDHSAATGQGRPR